MRELLNKYNMIRSIGRLGLIMADSSHYKFHHALTSIRMFLETKIIQIFLG